MMRDRYAGSERCLDQRVQRHDVEAAEESDQHEVGDHAPMSPARAMNAAMPASPVACMSRLREPQVDREHGEADRAERHEPDLHLAARQSLAQERPGADADREQREQERHDVLVAAQDVLREIGELGEERRAVEPEPRDAEHRQPHDAVAVARSAGSSSVSVNGFQLSRSAGSTAGVMRNARGSTSQPAIATTIASAPASTGPTPGIATSSPPAMVPSRIATNVPISTRPLPPTSSSGLQVLRQDRVLDRPEQRRVHAHQRTARRTAATRFGSQKPTRADHHDRDLEQLDAADQARLLVLVGELAGRRRQQHERQDEDARRRG